MSVHRVTLPRPGVVLGVALVWSTVWWMLAARLDGTTTVAGSLAWLVGGLGPLVAVLAGLRRTPADYRRSLRSRVFGVRIPARWWLAALAVGAGPRLVAVGLGAAGGHVMVREPVEVSAVPVMVAFAIVVVLIEEPLWRGVALDGFRSVVTAGLVIGVAWSVWHVPLYLVEGTWHHGLGLGTQDFWAMSVGIVGLSVVLVWLVVRSGGHVLLALVAHAVVNVASELVGGDPTVRTIEAGVIWVAALALLVTGRLRR